MSISNIVSPDPEQTDRDIIEDDSPKETPAPNTPTASTSEATVNAGTSKKGEDSPKEKSATTNTDANISTPVSAGADVSTASHPKKDEFLELLLDKIEPLGKSTTQLKMIIYGDPDAGKTTLASMIPNNLIIDAEDGTQSALNITVADNVRKLRYKTFEGLEKTIETFHKDPEQLRSIRTITIDTISNLHKRGLAEVVEREWRKSPGLVNRYVAETEHHTENNEHIRRLVQSLVDLNRNIILTAHARTIEPKGEPPKTFPDFSEKLSNTLMGMMDVVGYMYQFTDDNKKQHRAIKFHAGSGITAKSRIGGFPPNLVDPTWDKIESILNGD